MQGGEGAVFLKLGIARVPPESKGSVSQYTATGRHPSQRRSRGGGARNPPPARWTAVTSARPALTGVLGVMYRRWDGSNDGLT